MSSPNPLVDGHHAAQHSRRPSVVHALFDGVAARALDSSPKLVLGAVDALVPALSMLQLTGPTAEQVTSLFGGKIHGDRRDIARRCAALRFKNHAAVALLQKRGLDALAERVTSSCSQPPAHLVRAKGAILVSCHVGVHNGVSAALRRWGLEAFLLPLQGVEHTQRRSMAMRNAIEVLRSGGLVLAVMDGPFGCDTAPVECLGRSIVLRRGVFALARLTGAEMLPAVARWIKAGEIEPVIDHPLLPSPVLQRAEASGANDYERQLTRAAARWLEQYLLAHPEEAWPYTIDNFLQAPTIVPETVNDFAFRKVPVS